MNKWAASAGVPFLIGIALIFADRFIVALPPIPLAAGVIVCLLLAVSLAQTARSTEEGTHMETRGDQSPIISTQGDNSPVHYNASAQTVAPYWLDRPGRPEFRLSPHVDNSGGRSSLLCDFAIEDADPLPANIEARWSSQGWSTPWATPMRSSSLHRRKFQMKPAAFDMPGESATISFEVRFMLTDGQHGGAWHWPVHRHETKGHWILDAHLGSGVNQPHRDDTW
jgi:hypothetical protein